MPLSGLFTNPFKTVFVCFKFLLMFDLLVRTPSISEINTVALKINTAK